MSFFEKLEIWKEEYIFLKYVFLNFKDYKNLNFNFPIGIILLVLAVVFPITIFFANHKRNVTAICVKQLLRHDAIGEASAKTLVALRLSKIKSLKKALFSGGKFSSLVKIAGYKAPSYEEYVKAQKSKVKKEKPDFESIKIYLNEDRVKEAEEIASVGISATWKPIVISIATVLIIAVLFIFMPELLELLNDSVK